jgi:hypothetical protein
MFRRAKEEQERAITLEQELNNVKEKRLFAALHSPKFTLSSDEAKDVLDRLDRVAEERHVQKPTKVGRILSTSIDKDIMQLEQAEKSFQDKLAHYEETDREWHNLLYLNEAAKAALSDRKEQEIDARKALERAQQMVTQAKAHLVTTSNALKGVEQRVRRNSFEMDRVTSSLAKKQERVRVTLRKKVNVENKGLRVDYLTAEDVEALRQKENRLSGETKQVSMMVARLQSRAQKLKVRAEALEKWQQSGDSTIMKGKTP